MSKENSGKQYSVKQFYSIRTITGISVSPNGKTIAYIVNTDGLPNIWTIPIQGGWTTQISLEEYGVKGIHYSPAKKEILFINDFQGDENLQLHLISDKGGEVTHLSDGHSGSKILFAGWNKKGDKILYSSNKRDKKIFDSYIFNALTKKEECIFKSDDIYPYISAGWSRNENLILLLKFYHNSDQDIYLYNRSTNTLINITEHTGPMRNFDPSFNKKADTVYFLSDYEREFTGLAYYKVTSGEIGWFITENWDINSYQISKSGKYILYSVNEDGTTRLKLKNLKNGRTKSLKIPAGNVIAFEFTPDEKKIVLIHDSPRNPNDIHVYDIKKQKMKQITFSMIGGIPGKDFVIPQKITYKSFDELEISAYLYIPKWMKKDGSNPAVIWPHGGPEWQEKNLFNKYLQIMANRGYIVIAPNFRGSTGYGKTFQRLIYKDWGGNEFKDVLAAREYVNNTGYADQNRIAVVGGSFGGFMTLTCVTKAPDKWKCAVDVFGPSDLFTFQKSIPEHWKPGVIELVGDPEKDKELLFDRSPINFVENILCPLLIIQGKNDPRVALTESEQMINKLQATGKDVEYLLLEDEGHGFARVANQVKVWERICTFLDKHMKTS